MWRLYNTQVFHTFVCVSYVKYNPNEYGDDLLKMYVEDNITEVRIVFEDKGVKYAMRLKVDRSIVHSENKDIQNLWNQVYRHGEFE